MPFAVSSEFFFTNFTNSLFAWFYISLCFTLRVYFLVTDSLLMFFNCHYFAEFLIIACSFRRLSRSPVNLTLWCFYCRGFTTKKSSIVPKVLLWPNRLNLLRSCWMMLLGWLLCRKVFSYIFGTPIHWRPMACNGDTVLSLVTSPFLQGQCPLKNLGAESRWFCNCILRQSLLFCDDVLWALMAAVITSRACQ